VYFCAQFDTKPQKAQLFKGPYTGKLKRFHYNCPIALIELLDPNWPNATSASHTFLNGASILGAPRGYSIADRVGALFTFPSNRSVVKSKVGVSWISTEKACAFIDELNTWDLNVTAQAATKIWEDEILNKIEVYDTRNTTLLTMFYSAMYRSALLPSNRTGENPFWDDGVPYVDDICKFLNSNNCGRRSGYSFGRYTLGYLSLLVFPATAYKAFNRN
jgi:putative alpha-1,2-mannosidase